MRFGKVGMGLAIAASVSGLALWPSVTSLAASGEDVIKARIKFMEEELGGHWKVLAAFAKTGKGSLADVEKSALALVGLARELPSHFPKGSGRGTFPDDVTRALPAIWEEWPHFEKDARLLVDGSEKLAKLAKAGDTDAVVDMIGKSGSYARTKIGCAECHTHFRGARVKK